MALDGVDLNGSTEVSDQALRVPPAVGTTSHSQCRPTPVRPSVEGARRTDLVLAGSADAPELEAEVAKASSPLWLEHLRCAVRRGLRGRAARRQPGIWMAHCHNLEHAISGMMFHLASSRVSTPFTHGPGSRNAPE